ncbi:hypothetical protein MES5069_360097 [Mesorhizobium escarrei]|uniref:Uncharacterized protein n=1 Tax=Mesorhizobium escarrei TaxID=666018 RepID=A0ABN8K172_9HYPH|nr:hypothetical protein MES5069_360097 [Mesorhizobium escarrei]
MGSPSDSRLKPRRNQVGVSTSLGVRQVDGLGAEVRSSELGAILDHCSRVTNCVTNSEKSQM